MAFGGESLRRILSIFVHRTQCTHSSNTNLAADSRFEKAKEQQFHTFFIAQIILISHEYPPRPRSPEWRLRNPPLGLYPLALLFHQLSLPLRTTKTCARYIDYITMETVRTSDAFNQQIKEAMEPIEDLARSAWSEINKIHSAPASQRKFFSCFLTFY